jgi:hypothetical protein
VIDVCIVDGFTNDSFANGSSAVDNRLCEKTLQKGELMIATANDSNCQ